MPHCEVAIEDWLGEEIVDFESDEGDTANTCKQFWNILPNSDYEDKLEFWTT